mgnify:FL=1
MTGIHDSTRPLPDSCSKLSAPTHSIVLEKPGPGLGLVLQSGAYIPCTVYIPLIDLLKDACSLSDEQLAFLDVFMLNGKPVDSPKTTLVPCGARLALAAGLPGIAGLAMKSDSPVKGMRPGITHMPDHTSEPDSVPGPGHIEVVLYSLALKELADHFLRMGIILPARRLLDNLGDANPVSCLCDGSTFSLDALKSILSALPGKTLIYVKTL